ncbi:MAG: type II toxin-antitoxin system PemK/MazF family toxin [Candidatus Jacksonbacteria bacterium]
MKKGEIWTVNIPYLGGHEQSGTRPAIIMANAGSSVVLVIPCTSNFRALRFPYTIRLEPTSVNGLDIMSIALVGQLRAIDKKRLNKQIGIIEESILEEINQMLKDLLLL